MTDSTSIEKAPGSNGALSTMPLWDVTPATDVFESHDQFLLMLDVPGVDQSSLDIQVVQRSVHVHARQAARDTIADMAPAEFRRVIQLPADVDAQNVTAEYDRGVLGIRVPKAASARAVRVPVVVK